METLNFIARQKLRFDWGINVLNLLTFTLMVISSSDKMSLVVNLRTRAFVVLLVPAGIFGAWLMGFILDKCGFWHAYQAEQNQRNDMLKQMVQIRTGETAREVLKETK